MMKFMVTSDLRTLTFLKQNPSEHLLPTFFKLARTPNFSLNPVTEATICHGDLYPCTSFCGFPVQIKCTQNKNQSACLLNSQQPLPKLQFENFQLLITKRYIHHWRSRRGRDGMIKILNCSQGNNKRESL